MTCLSIILCASVAKSGESWQTFYEKSGGLETPRYQETMRYFDRLAKASPHAQLTSFGISPEGRSLPLFIISQDQAFTPDAAKKTGRLIVLIQGCIHAGESEGKDAIMLLARDLLIEKKFPQIMNSVTVLMVPIFNVDGHERFSAFQRINQNGPKEMGWRATAMRLNLNRDFIKADAPEMRQWLKMYHQWLPHLFYDCHTTDGIDYQYVLTYNIDEHEAFGGAVSKWAHESFLPAMHNRCEETGLIIGPYAGPVDEAHPEKGFVGGVWRPMLSNVYATVCNRAGFLIETHALKSYPVRVQATYDIILYGLQELVENGEKLKQAVVDEDKAMAAIGRTYDSQKRFPIQFRSLLDRGTPLIFRGYQSSMAEGIVSGRPYPVYRQEIMDIPTTYFNQVAPTITISPPLGYLISPGWRQILEVLDAHQINYQPLKNDVKIRCEAYRFSEVTFRRTSYEGRQLPSYKVQLLEEERHFARGTVFVPLACAESRLIINLLEPQAP
ncbi:M14 family metallopeptidase, partial [candidate division KSB1 bacterium]|nr:M14 family metallopeptidase [candidate division KSB1 bacterium]